MPVTDTILIIPAKDRDMQQVAASLRKNDFPTTLAKDTGEVFARIGQEGCSLVICPQHPEGAVEGPSCCLRLHASRSRLHPPVLLLLEAVTQGHVSLALEAGVDAILPFGCPESALLAEVCRLLHLPPDPRVGAPSLDIHFGGTIISTPLPAERALSLALSALACLPQAASEQTEATSTRAQPDGEHPAGQAPAPEVLDYAKTLARLKGDAAFLQLLYKTFLKDVDTRVQSMRSALDNRDIEGLCKLAHSLKGAAATIDAAIVREFSLRIETAAREGDVARCTQFLDKLATGLEELKGALLRHVTT
jgi:HPt (histidine-containing phosphotransfer) domain-containing protein